MTHSNSCPPADVIAAFASGELIAARVTEIREHVSHCDVCLETVGLLAARTASGHPADAVTAVRHPTLAGAGQVVDAYTLMRLVGEGGMGEVWEAQQSAPVRRIVALKLLKAGMDTRQVVSRFEAERQVLALMQHPGIAQVFDAGITDAGRPYFVMEFVSGVRITEYCDAKNLGVRERLVLFQQVCDAVQHAHQKGVIHRDLKPSNVLVTLGDKAQPKVIDFGLAKATKQDESEHSLTEMGTVLGTPAYASPEQMGFGAKDIDTRTDVYSLGVLLYELLIGVIPYDFAQNRPANILDLRQAIRDSDPAKPSTRFSSLGERASDIAKARNTDIKFLRKQLHGDLDWIVMKTLEKDRERRYASPHELSLDVERFLNHEPLLAGPPTAVYRMKKFVRRHRVGTVFAASIGALVIAFMVVTVVQARRIAAERDRATAEAAKANSINAFLQDTLGSADPWQTGKDISIREVLANAAKKVDSDFKDQPLIAAAVKTSIGRTYFGLGEIEASRTLLHEAFATRTSQLGRDHADVVDSLDALSHLHEIKGEYDESIRYAEEALAIERRIHVDQHDVIAKRMVRLANVLKLKGRLDEAEKIGIEALEIINVQSEPDSRKHLDALAMLGTNSLERGEYMLAEERLKRAMDISRRLNGLDAVSTADRMNDLGTAYLRLARLKEAEALYVEAIEIYARSLSADHPTTLITKENLAGIMVNTRRFKSAIGILDEVLAGRQRKLGENAPQVVRTMANVAFLWIEAGEYEKAVQQYEIALPRFEQAYGIDHPDTGFIATQYARALRLTGKTNRAESLLRSELHRTPSRIDKQPAYFSAAQLEFAQILLARREYAEAEPLLIAVFEYRRKSFGIDHARTKATAKQLADLYAAMGNLEKAAEFKVAEK